MSDNKKSEVDNIIHMERKEESEEDQSILQYEDSKEHDAINNDVSEFHEVSSSHDTSTVVSEEIATNEAPKNKILIQRVFHQPKKHVVEQKLDYVIADNEEEIFKHVYGGLFRTKYYRYSPESYCQKHEQNLYEHQDDSLVKLGDKFDSLESFRLYVDGNAKRWKYYLKCADSHKKQGKTAFVYQCVFARKRHKNSTTKGLRKRTLAVPRNDCPCRVIIKPVPFDAKDFTVIYVCNHHDHPLTDEYFYKLQHGRRIHPSIKAELMDLLALEVDLEIVKKYFESLTGYSMNTVFFQNMLNSMKKNNVERNLSFEKFKEMSKKIEKIKEELGMNDEEENVDNDLVTDDNVKKDKASRVAEVFQVLKTVSATRKIAPRQRTGRIKPDSGTSVTQVELNEPTSPSVQDVNSKSRLETRLQELKHDQETLQNIKYLQDSVRHETENNQWVIEEVGAETDVGTSMPSQPKRSRNSVNQSPVSEPMTIEPQAIAIENFKDEHIETPKIIYENEIPVMETVESSSENVENFINVIYQQEINVNDSGVEYCIPYNDEESVGQSEQYVLMLDDVESFENLAEVQVQATKFATVSIVSEDHLKNTPAETTDLVIEKTLNEELNIDDIVNFKNEKIEVSLQAADQIHGVNETCHDGTQYMQESEVYEVIQTNDKKIFPSKEIVNAMLLNKTSKSVKQRINHIEKSTKQLRGKSRRKTDVISQYFKEKSEKQMFDVFKNDIDNLDDDECYMIVVDDDENEVNDDQNSTEEEVGDYDTTSCGYADSLNSEKPKYFVFGAEEYNNEPHNHDKANNKVKVTTTISRESQTDELEEQKDVAFLVKKVESEKELLQLENAILMLRRQKVALEQDVEHLIGTKDDLIEDITKAARLSRRMYKSLV